MSQEIRDIAEELKHAGRIEGAEVGEWWIALAGLVPRVFDCASDDFLKAFEAELLSEYERLQEEFRVEIYVENKTVTYQKLTHCSEWEDEENVQ